RARTQIRTAVQSGMRGHSRAYGSARGAQAPDRLRHSGLARRACLYWLSMKLRIAENFRAVFYAPFYASRALGLAEREGLEVEWLASDTPGGTIQQVKRGAIDAQWGGPMRVLQDHDATRIRRLLCFAEVVWRDAFY